jgi:hypothetical protein
MERALERSLADMKVVSSNSNTAAAKRIELFMVYLKSQRLKARLKSVAFMARLKACPDANLDAFRRG